MAKRFVTHNLVIGELSLGDRLEMPADIVHHAIDVMRIKFGQTLEIMDQYGAVAVASLSSDGRICIEAIDTSAPKRSLFELDLYVALIKWPRFEVMLEKACELGVRRVVPLVCERSVVRPTDWGPKALRLSRIVQEASRQSLNRLATELHEPQSLAFALAEHSNGLKLYAHFGDYLRLDAVLRQSAEISELAVFIGPEGGFSPKELGHLERLAQPLSLGTTTLRTETAAIAVAASLAILS